MTDKIRAQLERAMTEQGKRRVDLSRATGIAQPNITRMLSGRSGEVPGAWAKVFDTLGFELCLCPNPTDEPEADK